jgi:diguanylate cyclase (GGDEF)-like protein
VRGPEGRSGHRRSLVIFITADADIDHEAKALSLGAPDFIRKPISLPSGRARVRNYLTMKEQADALRQLAAVDPLTGLANRRTFGAAVEQEWHRAFRARTSLAVAMIDIDLFKPFNDHHGHPAGDGCLRMVAGALKGAARRPGDLVARYGGEEFAAILPGLDIDGALSFGRILCERVRGLAIGHGYSPVSPIVTVSVGVATLVPHASASAGDLVVVADRALYDVKAQGRNRVAAAPA